MNDKYLYNILKDHKMAIPAVAAMAYLTVSLRLARSAYLQKENFNFKVCMEAASDGVNATAADFWNSPPTHSILWATLWPLYLVAGCDLPRSPRRSTKE